MLKRVPLPFAGVMLGFAALGNLLQTYSEGVHLFCGIIAGLIGIVLILKTIVYFDLFKEDMKNPIMASVSGTFSMALMLLAGYLKPFMGPSAISVWYVGIALHVILIIYFTCKFILKLDIKKVFASYYIVYVGIAVASVSAPAFNQMKLGTIFFWFGLVTFVALLILVSYRYIKYKDVPNPAKPLFCITTAPMSLCLAGYIQSVMPKNLAFVYGMAIVASILYIIVLINLPKFLKMPFFPSYAAFTFPFVISAIAMKMTMMCSMNMGHPISFLPVVVLIETIIATCLVLYSFARFVMTICKSPKAE